MGESVRKPDFFIVGAPKSGTTSLNEYLKAHPAIFIPEAKELHYFGSDLYPEGIRRMTREEYLAYFRKASDEKRCGEASVRYLFSKNAAREIHEFNPEAGIIIMLRNPVDYLYSLHSQLLFNGTEEITDFEKALEAEETRKTGKLIPRGGAREPLLFYHNAARFSEQVARYLDVFGKARVHVILFEEFKENPAASYRAVLEFLGIDPTFQPVFEIHNPNKIPRFKFLVRPLAPLPASVRQFIWRTVPRGLMSAMRMKLQLWNRKFAPNPPMDPMLRKKLQKEFEPEIARLSQILGRDLSLWLEEPAR